MKKFIRLPGLVAFLIFFILLTVFSLFFVDGIVEKTIEKAGTKAVGAKVELADADFSFIPTGLKLTTLQVTDPEAPMKNAVEIADMDLSLDTLNLLRRKVIINEMSVTGVKFNTARKKSGAVKKLSKTKDPEKKALEKAKKKKAIPSFDIKDVKSILAKEKLTTIEEINRIKADMEKDKADLKKQLKNLPDKKTFKEHKKRYKEIKEGSGNGIGKFLGQLGGAYELKKDIKKDIKKVKKARNDLRDKVKEYEQRLKDASQAPLKDAKRIKDKYAVSPRGLGNMTGLIFGPEYSKWVNKGITWFHKLKPYLAREKTEKEKPAEPERGKGITVRFKEHTPLPDLLIRKAAVSLDLDVGTIAGIINNITPDQDILGQPLTFNLSGEKMKGLNEAEIKGTCNHVVPEQSFNKAQAKLIGYNVKDLSVSGNPEIPVVLKNAIADMRLSAFIKGEDIDSSILLSVKGANFSDKGKGSSQIARAVHSALSGVSSFSVSATIKGTLENHDVQIKSDLDNAIKNGVSDLVKKQAVVLEEKLKKEILAKTKDDLDKLKNSLSGFDVFEKELSGRIKEGSGIIGMM